MSEPNHVIKPSDLRQKRPNIYENGFDWHFVQEYFPFSDELSEGEYGQALEIALSSINEPSQRKRLLDMLDLQYALLIHHVGIQESMLSKNLWGRETIAFKERLSAYLQINLSSRRLSQLKSIDARRHALDEAWIVITNLLLPRIES